MPVSPYFPSSWMDDNTDPTLLVNVQNHVLNPPLVIGQSNVLTSVLTVYSLVTLALIQQFNTYLSDKVRVSVWQ